MFAFPPLRSFMPFHRRGALCFAWIVPHKVVLASLSGTSVNVQGKKERLAVSDQIRTERRSLGIARKLSHFDDFHLGVSRLGLMTSMTDQ